MTFGTLRRVTPAASTKMPSRQFSVVAAYDDQGSSLPDQVLDLAGFHPDDDRPDHDLFAPLIRMEMAAAARIPDSLAPAHRHQTVASISPHFPVRIRRARVVFVVDVKPPRRDVVVIEPASSELP